MRRATTDPGPEQGTPKQQQFADMTVAIVVDGGTTYRATMQAMIDSGCESSLMSTAQARRLPPDGLVRLQPHDPACVQLADDCTKVPIAGVYYAHVQFGDCITPSKFYITDIPVDCILGGDFFGFNRSTMSYDVPQGFAAGAGMAFRPCAWHEVVVPTFGRSTIAAARAAGIKLGALRTRPEARRDEPRPAMATRTARLSEDVVLLPLQEHQAE